MPTRVGPGGPAKIIFPRPTASASKVLAPLGPLSPALRFAHPGPPPLRTLGLGLSEWLLTLTLGRVTPWDWGYGSGSRSLCSPPSPPWMGGGKGMGGGLHPVDGWLAKNSAYCSGVWRMTTTPPPGSGLLPIVIEMVPMRVPMATSSPVTATMSFDQRDMGGGYPPTLGLWKWDRFPAAGRRAPPHRSSRPAAGTLLVPRRLLSARVAHPPTAGGKRWSRGGRSVRLAGG